jgi:cytochrome bd-type quinol oxidase subunit 1
MADGLLLITAVADSIRSYGEFPVIGARAAVWIAAEVHLMFAAFVLGVPMFAVVAEAIGIFAKDAKYDVLAKEFTRLLLVAYSATAIWGAILVFLLSTMYPRFWASLTAVFGTSMWVYVVLHPLLYCTAGRWKYKAKIVHWTLGILLNVGTVMLMVNPADVYDVSTPRHHVHH